MSDTAACFALGSAEVPRSLRWRAWTMDDEFHLAARRGADHVELTAYPTGRWRIDTGGEIGRWHRPTQSLPGWTRGPAVVLPGWNTATVDQGKSAGEVTWIPAAGEGRVTRVQVWFAIPGAEERRWRYTQPKTVQSLMSFSLRRAGSVRLMWDEEPGPDDGLAPPEGVISVSTDEAGLPSFWEIPV